MKEWQEFLLKFCLSTQGPQASEEGAPGGTDGLGYCHRAENYSSADTGPSIGMHIELQKEGILQHDYS
jgi:hypothetical protein